MDHALQLKHAPEDYLTGYEADNGEWIPGLLVTVARLQSRESLAIWFLAGMAAVHFLGIDTLKQVIDLFIKWAH